MMAFVSIIRTRAQKSHKAHVHHVAAHTTFFKPIWTYGLQPWGNAKNPILVK